MALTTRAGKGAPLTNAEVDGNFQYLETLANSKMDNTGKATKEQAEAGTDDTVWMSPLNTHDAILAQVGGAVQRFSIDAVGTGASQNIAIPVDANLDELLIFVNGVEQDGVGITKTPGVVTGTFAVGDKIRVMLAGGFAGKSFKPDAIGPLSERSLYNSENARFVFMDTDEPRLGLYIHKGSGTWDGPYYVQGPQGDQGDPGNDGINAQSPWEKKTASFSAADKGRYYMVGAGIVATLPAAGDGKEVWFCGSFKTNNATIGRNGATIAGLASDLVLNEDNISPKLVCFDGNWSVAR